MIVAEMSKAATVTVRVTLSESPVRKTMRQKKTNKRPKKTTIASGLWLSVRDSRWIVRKLMTKSKC